MRFALITEGASENKIIKHVITKYFKDNEIFFRDAQPQLENTGKQKTGGGWNEVLKYCQRTNDLLEIFNNSDYLVIQIDTDQSEQKPFNVKHLNLDNTLKTNDELYNDALVRLKELIAPEIFHAFNDKILFAICIHTIECWLLPLYYTNNHKTDTRNCINTLNTELKRKNIRPILNKDKNSSISVRTYESVLRNWRKREDLSDAAKMNVGFQNFIVSLNNIES